MKKETILKALAMFIVIASATAIVSFATSSHHTKCSWELYCEKYGVDVNNPTDAQIDRFFDCYVGNAEEAADLQNTKIFALW